MNSSSDRTTRTMADRLSTRKAVSGHDVSPDLLQGLGMMMRTLSYDSQNNISLVCDCCLKLLRAEFVVYNRFALEREQIVTRGGSGLPEDFRNRGRLRGRICYEEFVSGAKTKSCLHHLHQTAYWQSDPDLKKYGLRAYVGASVMTAGFPSGSLAAYHRLVDAFTDEDGHALEIMAIMLGILDERHNVLEDLNQKKTYEKMVAEISAKTITDREKGLFLDHCLQIIGQSLKVDATAIYWYEPWQSTYKRASFWMSKDCAEQSSDGNLVSLLHLPYIEKTLAAGKIFCCDETGVQPDFAIRKNLREQGIGALLIIPLCGYENQNGVFLAEMKNRARSWRSENLAILKIIMQMMGKWIESHTIACKLSEREVLHTQLMQKLPPTAIYGIDLANHRFLHVNEHMCQAMGYTEEEFLSLRPEELLTPESRIKFRERLMAMAAGRPVSDDVEFQLITKSGAIEWGQFYIRHIFEGGRISGATVVAHMVTERKKEQAELQSYRRKLEILVEERTRELSDANLQLRKEIDRHTNTAKELRLNSERLKELNTAMRVLLDKRKEERERIEENIRINLKELIEPYLSRLECSELSKSQRQMIGLIRMNLDEVFGTSVPEISSSFLFFTPNELQVVNLIRKGKTTKDIAHLLNISTRTVEAYRNSIRKKLGLKNKKVNLRTYLSSKK